MFYRIGAEPIDYILQTSRHTRSVSDEFWYTLSHGTSDWKMMEDDALRRRKRASGVPASKVNENF